MPVQEVTSDEGGLPANDEDAENNNNNRHPSSLPSSIIIDGTDTISIGDHMRWLEENDINVFNLLNTTLTTRNMAASKVTTPECNTIIIANIINQPPLNDPMLTIDDDNSIQAMPSEDSRVGTFLVHFVRRYSPSISIQH